MATITVTGLKISNPGPGGFCRNYVEVNSVTLAARRISVIGTQVANLPAKWTAGASDPTAGTMIGMNYVAGSNVTSNNPSTTHQVFVPGTVIDINSNATGLDPTPGTAFGLVVSSNDFQLDVTDLSNDRFICIGLSPDSTSGDTNVRCLANPLSTALVYTAGV